MLFIAGKSAQNPNKFLKTRFVQGQKEIVRGIADPLFHGLSSLDGVVHEISSKIQTINEKDPLQIAFCVYADAKICMLSFVYDFIDKYFPRTAYEICSTDTDSLYFAYAECEEFEDLVKPHLRRDYFINRGKFLPSEVCESPECVTTYVEAKTNKLPWKQLPCCRKSEVFHNRTPGLYKTEYKGDEICFLAPKTYCAENEFNQNIEGDYAQKTKQKISCKGVNKGINPLKMEDFKKVLFDGEKHSITNRGFRFIDGKMRTYAQLKCGLSPIFIKRKVCDDRIHTEPLDL